VDEEVERKIILNLAMSLDGYIAENDGGYDWIKGDLDSQLNTLKSFDLSDFASDVDTIVMGKTTYLENGPITRKNFPSQKILVASNKPLNFELEKVERIHGNIIQQILELKQTPGKNIWLFGGALLTDNFIKADIIDEYIVGIIPIILGDGKKLFLGRNPRIQLHLTGNYVMDGIVILTYEKIS